jgi:hypothetical protein
MPPRAWPKLPDPLLTPIALRAAARARITEAMLHPEDSWDRLHHMQVANEYERKADLAQRIIQQNVASLDARSPEHPE